MTFSCLIKIPNQSDESDIRTAAADLSKQLSITFDPHLALLHLPSTTEDRYTSDGVSQYSIIEIHHNNLQTIEQNIHDIKLILTTSGVYAEPIIQVMLAREFDILSASPFSLHNLASYFVEYSGQVDSASSWTNHYVNSHVHIMKRLPRIKDILVFSPVMWLYPEHTNRFESVLCNRVSFQSHSDLQAALKSPIRDEMRKDYDEFPHFDGVCTHFAMDTYVLINQRNQCRHNNAI